MSILRSRNACLVAKTQGVSRAVTSHCMALLQDEHGGGISDRPDDMVDVFHTFFGIAVWCVHL